MPRRTISNPPAVMTWGRALPVLIVAGITDVLKIIFEWLVFFAPAFAGIYCATQTGSTVIGSVCTVAAGVASFFGAGAIELFGLIMAMAIAFTGWIIIGFWILATNYRIFKANATTVLWFIGSLALGLVPFLNTLPFLTGTLLKLYRTQIKVERAAFKQWEKENVAAQRMDQLRSVQMAQIQQQQEQAALDGAV